MHYYLLMNDYIEFINTFPAYIYNVLGVVFDVCFVFVIFFLILKKNQKAAINSCFIITLLWSFSNILYARFFHHYISLSVFSQTGNLTSPLLLNSAIMELKWEDLYFLIAPLAIYMLSKRFVGISRPLLIPIVILVLASAVDVYGRTFGRINLEEYNITLNTPYFLRGTIRSLAFEIAKEMEGVQELTALQRDEIKKTIKTSKKSIAFQHRTEPKNIIFILVESYMSIVSGMKTGGREVTPFLNSLKFDSTVYYNGHMHENVTIGESSDGQFIYMTGLLPLRGHLTVSKAWNKTLPGMPKQFGKESRMIIPTNTTIWNQKQMTEQYGFDYLYSSVDCPVEHGSILNDEQVFKLAMNVDTMSKQPFFSVILTMSMHHPYQKLIDPTFPIADKTLPDDYACYLNACHYTDRQIEQYFKHLKHTGLYDNSLIVIAADHPVHSTDFGGVSKDIPLYIVNLPSEIKKKMWTGECNQLDVYTTLMDLLGIESDWYGLGQSLISPNYQSTIDSKKWDVSEWIIRGDYFNSVVAFPSISHKP